MGVLPLSIKDIEFTATNITMEEGREVEINGTFAEISAEYVINLDGLSVQPSVGSILTDPSGRQVKILRVVYDDDNNPLHGTFICEHRHINS